MSGYTGFSTEPCLSIDLLSGSFLAVSTRLDKNSSSCCPKVPVTRTYCCVQMHLIHFKATLQKMFVCLLDSLARAKVTLVRRSVSPRSLALSQQHDAEYNCTAGCLGVCFWYHTSTLLFCSPVQIGHLGHVRNPWHHVRLSAPRPKPLGDLRGGRKFVPPKPFLSKLSTNLVPRAVRLTSQLVLQFFVQSKRYCITPM